MSNKKEGITFIDGFSPRKELMGVIAYPSELEDTDIEFTRFYMYKPFESAWAQREFDHDIVSITFTPPDRTWHLLSKRGSHIQSAPGIKKEIEIKDAGTGPNKYGYVSQIRSIGDHLYVCGFCRQVYRFENNNWVHCDSGILAPAKEIEFNLMSIDGTSENDIYVVGWKGEIFHYNGASWKKFEIQTNLNINRVRCVNRDLIYACGDKGIFIKGSGSSWEVFKSPEVNEDLWGLEVFKDTPYISSLKGLYKFDGYDLIPVETGLKPKIDGYRLHANDDILWSFGNRSLAFFDGKIWTLAVNPDM